MNETERETGKDETQTGAETQQPQDAGSTSEPKSDDNKEPA